MYFRREGFRRQAGDLPEEVSLPATLVNYMPSLGAGGSEQQSAAALLTGTCGKARASGAKVPTASLCALAYPPSLIRSK